MVILGDWNGKPVTLSFKPNCLTLSISTRGQADVFSWDGVGRLWTAFEDGISYRRGLNGVVVAKWQTPIPPAASLAPSSWVARLFKPAQPAPARAEALERRRRWLSSEEALALEERARRQLQALRQALLDGQARLEQPLPAEGEPFLAAALAFDRERSQAEAEGYRQVYLPVGILPPDQYFSVVLQATEGCSFNTCTYCNFYRDRPFRIKSGEAFRRHAAAVKDFIGAGLSLRRTIFLGDANALAAPMPRLRELVEVVHEFYDVRALGGLYAFLDGFSGERKSEADFAWLAQRGFERVYVGMESGNAELLRFLHKPGGPEDVVRTVQAMKSGGLAVGVIVLLGAGGKTYARRHEDDTIAAINRMGLDGRDLIYFSELVEHEGLEYSRDAHQAQLQPLSGPERLAQQAAIEQALVFSEQAGTPHISRYDIREFVY